MASEYNNTQNAVLPQEMNYGLPASLPAAKTFEIRVQPVNQQTFTSGQVLQFDIPAGKLGQFLDCQTTYIRFKATYTVAAGGTAGTNFSYLLGSGYSYFNKSELYGNNSVLLESIGEFGVCCNALLQTQLNSADKIGLSSSMGFNANNGFTVLGHKIFDSATSINYLTFSYSLPIVGLLGSGCDKFFPIGNIHSLRYELTMDAITNFTLQATALSAIATCTLSEIEFVGQVVELDQQPYSIIQAQNPNFIHLRCQSYRTATNYLASGSSGLNDILIGIRCSSLKSMFITCSPSNALEKKYSSVCPNLTQGTCLIVSGSTSIPQRTLNPVNHPADTFTELQKALGAFAIVNYNGAVSKDEYYRSSTSTGLMAAYNTTLTNVTELNSNSSLFIMGLNCEIVAHRGGLLSGINTNSSPSFFRCQIDTAISLYQHTFYFFAYHDVILEIDVNAKSIVAKF